MPLISHFGGEPDSTDYMCGPENFAISSPYETSAGEIYF